MIGRKLRRVALLARLNKGESKEGSINECLIPSALIDFTGLGTAMHYQL